MLPLGDGSVSRLSRLSRLSSVKVLSWCKGTPIEGEEEGNPCGRVAVMAMASLVWIWQRCDLLVVLPFFVFVFVFVPSLSSDIYAVIVPASDVVGSAATPVCVMLVSPDCPFKDGRAQSICHAQLGSQPDPRLVFDTVISSAGRPQLVRARRRSTVCRK